MNQSCLDGREQEIDVEVLGVTCEQQLSQYGPETCFHGDKPRFSMTIRILGLCALAAALLAAIVHWMPPLTPSPPPTDRSPTERAPAVPVHGLAGADAAMEQSPMLDSSATRQAVDSPATRAAERLLATVRGRCVADETGSPLVGCKVDPQHYWSPEDATAPVGWRGPAALTTAADGRFELEYDVREGARFALFVHAAGRAGMFASLGALEPGQERDLGDVRMLSGAQLRVRAFDSQGEPVSGVRVQVAAVDPRPASASATPFEPGLVPTDEKGELPPRVLFPGVWSVGVDSPWGHAYDGVSRFEVLPGESVFELDLPLHLPPLEQTLSGRLVDEVGDALEGVELHAQLPGGSHQSTTSRSGGSFVFPRLMAGDGLIELRLARDEKRYRLLDAPRAFELGTTGILLSAMFLPECHLQIEVVDGDTGAPVERFGWRTFSDPWTTFDHAERRRAFVPVPASFHRGGLATVDGLREGLFRLSIWPEDHALLPRTVAPVHVSADWPVDGSSPPTRIELRRAAPLRVQLVSDDGRAVQGSRVQLLRYLGSGSSWGLDHVTHDLDTLHRGLPGTTALVILAEGQTDSAGRVTLLGPPYEEYELALKALGPGHVPRLQKNVRVMPGGTSIEVVVERGAVVHGRIGPLELLMAYAPDDEAMTRAAGADGAAREADRARYRPRVELRRAGSDPRERLEPVRVDVDGSFRIDGVPPGLWRAALCFERQLGERGSSTHRELLEDSIVLNPGTSYELIVVAPEFLPARISGWAVLDGEPFVDGQVELGGAEAAPVRVRPDDRGYFSAPPLPPGRYVPSLLAEDSLGEHVAIVGSEAIDAPAGVHVQTRIDLER